MPASPSAPLRIVFLIGSYHPVVGGGERHARLLARSLAGLGAAITVLTCRRNPAHPARETFEGAAIRRFGPVAFPRLAKYLLVLPAFLWLLRHRREYDAVLVCGFRVLGLPALLARLFTRRPVVLRAEALGEFDGAFVWRSPEGRVSRLRRLLFALPIALRNALLRRADAFLAISTPVREEFLACRVPPSRIALIPNGYDPAVFRPLATPPPPPFLPHPARTALRRELRLPLAPVQPPTSHPSGGPGFVRADPQERDRDATATCFAPPSPPLFAYSGKLIRGKGLEFLLRVWREVTAARPDAKLLLVGSGAGQSLSCEDALRRYAADSLPPGSVFFAGYSDRVQDYLRAADAFLFPSERESQGLAPLEAMACGLPVLASDIPGIQDMIRPGLDALLLPPNDLPAWRDAILSLLADPARAARLASSAAAHAAATYAIPPTAQSTLALFQSLLSRPRPPSSRCFVPSSSRPSRPFVISSFRRFVAIQISRPHIFRFPPPARDGKMPQHEKESPHESPEPVCAVGKFGPRNSGLGQTIG